MSSSDDDSDDDNGQHNENSLILYNAAHDGELDKCIEAIKNGASPDYQKHNGYTPLHISAQEGHVEIVKYLIVKYGSFFPQKKTLQSIPQPAGPALRPVFNAM